MSSQNPWWGKTLRTIGIVLMSVTAAFTLMGGAGTTCVALNPTGFGGKFAGIAPFQWLYVLFVLATLAVGAWGVRAVVQLIKGARRSYRQALVVLAAGALIGAIHMASSRALRGSSMPVDMVVYTTIITLVLFLLFRLPGVWTKLGFESPRGGSRKGGTATAAALASTGMLALTVQFVMAPTHTMGGVNYADAWHAALTLIGVGLIAMSAVLRLRLRLESTGQSLVADAEAGA